MTTQATTARVFVPPIRAVPRGAKLVALLFDVALRAIERRRAAREAALAAREAESVRRQAREMLRTDPGFAADLLAAADRHVSPH